MADVNQAVVDEILAKAAEETEEGRLEKLEKEVETLKGSIKRLLLDIREMMNNLENPFQNLQSLTEVSSKSKAPQIQLISAIPEKPEEKKEEKKEEEKEEIKKPKEEDLKKEEVVAKEDLKEDFVPSVKPEVGKNEGLMMQQIQTEKVEPLKKPEIALTKYDIVVLYKLMNWVKGMLEKYDANSLRLMLEVFSIAGYISSEAKEFLHMLTELLSANNGFEEMLLELYRLHKIMNPADKAMDSQLLALILEKKL
ncbi:MAG: hypothetical protein QFX40_06445 [Archaeoglobales archaeon]|nr:hypothetical protein [Archaeoglobales archaeon]